MINENISFTITLKKSVMEMDGLYEVNQSFFLKDLEAHIEKSIKEGDYFKTIFPEEINFEFEKGKYVLLNVKKGEGQLKNATSQQKKIVEVLKCLGIQDPINLYILDGEKKKWDEKELGLISGKEAGKNLLIWISYMVVRSHNTVVQKMYQMQEEAKETHKKIEETHKKIEKIEETQNKMEETQNKIEKKIEENQIQMGGEVKKLTEQVKEMNFEFKSFASQFNFTKLSIDTAFVWSFLLL